VKHGVGGLDAAVELSVRLRSGDSGEAKCDKGRDGKIFHSILSMLWMTMPCSNT
jgi:hypothetical protein